MNTVARECDPRAAAQAVDAHPYRSLNDMLAESCERYAGKTAFSCLGGAMSYAQLDRLSVQFAVFLAHDLALARGERLAIMLPNLPQYPVALFGALRAGLVAVNVNPLYTADELVHQLADSGAAAIIVLENFAHTVEHALERTPIRHIIVTRTGDLLPFARRQLVDIAVKYVKRAVPPWRIGGAWRFRSALARGRRSPVPGITPAPGDVALLQYTGGTTGRPKGAMLTHANLIANVEQLAAWVAPVLKPGEETVITALPLSHIFALTANLLLFVRLGGCNILVPDARNIPALVHTLARSRFTSITGVNTLFKALLDAPGFPDAARAARGTIKVAVSGGMGVEREVAERWHAMIGVPLIEGYGLTEASPVVCANRLDAQAFTGKLGLPLPGTAVRIDRDDGSEAATGEPGEICVRGPQVMPGYWNAPEETRQTFTADGWLRTGDIGRMDEAGFVEFVDRKKDVIVVSGFKAYPTEIEAVAMQHPGVKDAAAVGVADARTGEAVALFIVRKDPSLTAQSIREHCARHLTGYKRPKHVEFRDQLPKGAIGKTLRRKLAEESVARKLPAGAATQEPAAGSDSTARQDEHNAH